MLSLSEIFEDKQQESGTIIQKCNINLQAHSQKLLKAAKIWQPKFKATEQLDKIFIQLFYYFTGNKIDETFKIKYNIDDLSHDKGIWVVGNTGSGKSFLIELFRAYTGEQLYRNSFIELLFEKIVSNYRDFGEKAFDELSYSETYRARAVYVDDFMNVKFDVKNYGDAANVAETILNTRYRVYTKFKKLTHVSTNIYPSQLKEFSIDDRIVGRCAEMFNIIELSGVDYRRNGMIKSI